jgi:FkbM family methyltransferase
MPGVAYHVRGLVRAAGLAKAGEILLRRSVGAAGPVSVRVQGHDLRVRPVDSDLFVLSQIFGWEEYKIDGARLARLREVASGWRRVGCTPVIVDAGANVGYSALYFARLFPDARILAVEPDPESFAVLTRHARGAANVTPIHAALWSHNQGLRLRTSDAGSWSTYAAEGSGTPSIRLDDLMASIPNARPLVIKLDIEGAEREVVESCPDIFAEAKCVLVEPHDFMRPQAACLSPLYRVAARKEFDTILSGENLQLFALD